MEKQDYLLLEEESTAVNTNLTQHVPSQELLLDNDSSPCFTKIEIVFDAPPPLSVVPQSSSIFNWQDKANHLYFTHQSDEQNPNESIAIASPRRFKSSSVEIATVKIVSYTSLISQLEKALEIITFDRKKTAHLMQTSKANRQIDIKIGSGRKDRPMSSSVLFSGLATSRQPTRKISLDISCENHNTFKQGKSSRSQQKQYYESVTDSRQEIKARYKTEFVIVEQKESEIVDKKQGQQRGRVFTLAAHTFQRKERKEKIKAQQAQALTFTPTINLKSREIMKKKGKLAPIHQRECKGKLMALTLTQSTKIKPTETPKQ